MWENSTIVLLSFEETGGTTMSCDTFLGIFPLERFCVLPREKLQ